MLQGLMMQMPLLISSLIEHADRHHGARRNRFAQSRRRYPPHDLSRACIAAHGNGQRAGGAGHRARVTASRRLRGTATGTWRFISRSSGAGSVLHTINPRLHPEQIAWIVNHAKDRVLFFDLTFLPLVEAIAPLCGNGEALGGDDRSSAYAGLGPAAHLLCYEDLIDCSIGPVSPGRSLTRTLHRRCATRRARPAIRRACCTRTVQRCCTR